MRVLPSATKVTFFGVVTARVSPPRPSGWDREAESTAPSARMPRSVQRRVDGGGGRPVLLGLPVDRDRQLAAVAHRDVVTVVDRGGEGGNHDVVRADRDVLLVEDVGDGGPEDVDRGGLPVDGDLDGLVVVGHTDRTGGHRRARRRPGRHDEGVERTAQVLQGRAPRAPASDVSRRAARARGRGSCVRPAPPTAAAAGAVTRVVRGESGPGHSLHRAGRRGPKVKFR